MAYVYFPATAEHIAKADASLLYGPHRHSISSHSRERGKRCAQRLYYDRNGLPYVARLRWYRRYVMGVEAYEIDGRVLETSYALVLGERTPKEEW